MRGVVSLLFTDIVSSTRAWIEYEAEMADDLARHDSLLHEACRTHGGQVFKHTGDGMIAWFPEPTPALRAAAAAQHAMASGTWRVPGGIRIRAAVHSGAVHARDDDLFGPTVNRSARLLGRCPPGGVLVSEVTAGLVAHQMPVEFGLRELGRVQLRDLAHSEMVYGLTAAHLVEVDPMTVTTSAPTPQVGLLPAVDSDLVGRQGEMTRVTDAVRSKPVVSIVGAGGMGKTRLAIAAAKTLAPQFGDGVWWCDLAVIGADSEVPTAVLKGLAARPQQDRDSNEMVIEHLGDRHALIVLDNCEHVVNGASRLVTAIRHRCPNVKVLTTSQEALGIGGEQVITLSSINAEEAERLFMSRATEVRPDLVWDETTRADVGELCVQLDGIPLAIELAAARCRSMSPGEIRDRLDDRFRLLRGGRGQVERHRTLHATVAWSYGLLGDDERRVFDRMAVFHDGAALDGVVAVTGLDEIDAVDVLDRLAARSLIAVVDTPIGTRYGQLVTMRRFARERLIERGELDEVVDAHLAWAMGLAEWMRQAVISPSEAVAFRRYLAEYDNLRAAVSRALVTGQVTTALRIVSDISLWALCRPNYEVLDWVDESFVAAAADSAIGARLAGQLAELAVYAGDLPRADRLLANVADASNGDAHCDRATAAKLLWAQGDVDRAERVLLDCITTDPVEDFLRDFYLLNVANVRLTMAAPEDRGWGQSALAAGIALVARCRSHGGQLSRAVTLAIVGYLHLDLGDHASSMAVAAESAQLAQELGAWFIVDLAQLGTAESLTEIQMTPEDRLSAIRWVRDLLAEAVGHRNHFMVRYMLGYDVALTLWRLDRCETALLVGAVSSRLHPGRFDPLPADAAAVVGPEVMSSIVARAGELSLSDAASCALAALDDALARFDDDPSQMPAASG